MSDVAYEGIQNITLDDVRYAKDLGFVVKLIGAARLIDGQGERARVPGPACPQDHPLASISGSNNAVFLQGDAIGEIMLMGPGAGGHADGDRGGERHRLHRQHQGRRLPAELLLLPRAGLLPGRRGGVGLLHQDERGGPCPGVLAQIASVFGEHEVSIASMIQKGQGRRGRVGAHHPPHQGEGLLRRHRGDEGVDCCKSEPMTLRVL